MRAGMQDPIITLRNMFLNNLKDKNNNNVPVFTYWDEAVISQAGNAGVWVSIGHPEGITPRDTWLGLRGAGFRYYRSWRYPVFVGGWDLESIYKVKAKIMEIIRTQDRGHSAAPEYIEFMYVELVNSRDMAFERTTPPFIHFVIYVVVEFLEL